MPITAILHKLTEADIGFVPDVEKVYKDLIKDFKQTLRTIERRYYIFSQQQMTFITALDNCRHLAMEATTPIINLYQVSQYRLNVAENKTDRRILTIFLLIIDDLNKLREDVINLTHRTDDTLEQLYFKWSKTLSPRQNVALIKTKASNPQLNYLGFDEVNNHFGGIVNVIPAALEQGKVAIKRLEEVKAYIPNATTSDESVQRIIMKLNKTARRMQKFPTPKFNRIVKVQ